MASQSAFDQFSWVIFNKVSQFLDIFQFACTKVACVKRLSFLNSKLESHFLIRLLLEIDNNLSPRQIPAFYFTGPPILMCAETSG